MVLKYVIIFCSYFSYENSSSYVFFAFFSNLILNFDAAWNDVWTEGPAEILFTGNFKLDLLSK